MARAPEVDPRRFQGVPRVRWVQPAHEEHDADDAIFFASSYGLIPDLWQASILCSWLGRRRNGRWTHPRCGLAVPRQNGKNGGLEVRELFGLVVLHEAILHTAHQVKTSRKAFKRLKHFFGETDDDPDAKFPELNALVAEVRNTNGQEAIVLKDVWLVDGIEVRSKGRPVGRRVERVAAGGFIEFATRTQRGGRGTTYDLLVIDEAQHLSEEDLAAVRPVISSARGGNAQVIYLGTPPDPEKISEGVGQAWTRIRAGAGKAKDLAWIEYGAPDGPMPDLDDVELLYAANPSLEVRHGNGDFGLSLDVIFGEDGHGGEKADLTPADYARERLGWWGNPEAKTHRGVIDMSQWRELKVPGNTVPTSGLLVVDCSPDQEWTTVALAAPGEGGRPLVLVQHEEGTSWAGARVEAMADGLQLVEAVSLTPTAAHLTTALTAAGVAHQILSKADVRAACTPFQLMIPAGEFEHVGQPELEAAARQAITRYVGGVQEWDTRNPKIDISPLVASSVAVTRLTAHLAKPPERTPAAPRRAGALATTTQASPTRRRRRSDVAHVGF